MGRISIAGVLGFVAIFAIGLAALVNATSAWAGLVFILTIGLLLTSVLGLILRGWRRGGWLGFALFGWGYFLIGHIAALGLAEYSWTLPDTAADWIFSKANVEPVPPPSMATGTPGSTQSSPEDLAYFGARAVYNERSNHALVIGRWLSVLLFAEVGAVIGLILGRGRRQDDAPSNPA
jgi:hypothetical protein